VQNYWTWVHLASSQLLVAAIANWTITKSQMAIQSNTAIQANLHKHLAIKGMVNGAVSVMSYSGAYPADTGL